MSGNIDKLSHGRVAQHASVKRERDTPSCSTVGATSFHVYRLLEFTCLQHRLPRDMSPLMMMPLMPKGLTCY